MAFTKGAAKKKGSEEKQEKQEKPEATAAELAFFEGGWRLACRAVNDAKVEEIGENKTKKVTLLVEQFEQITPGKGEPFQKRSSYFVDVFGVHAKDAEKVKKGDFLELEGHFQQDNFKPEGSDKWKSFTHYVISLDDDSITRVDAPK